MSNARKARRSAPQPPTQGIIIDILHHPQGGEIFRARPKSASAKIGDPKAAFIFGTMFRQYIRTMNEETRAAVLAETGLAIAPEPVEDGKEVQP